MKPIVENVKKLLIKNPPSFFPPRFKKTLEEWLKKTNDWCISRQLL
jgi:valyl-tRNA synthetase